jgi:hypothetical protein
VWNNNLSRWKFADDLHSEEGKSVNDLRSAQFEAVRSFRAFHNRRKRNHFKAVIPCVLHEEHRIFYMEMCGDNV